MAIPGIKRTPPSVITIYKIVAKYYGYNPDNIENSDIKRNITIIRHIAMYFAREMTNESHDYIGKNIGHRDHSTSVYATKKINDLMEVDRTFCDEIKEIRQKIRREFL